MIEIDGAYGEGGGQLVRMAVALAAVGTTPIRIVRVRAHRRKPGLAAQHAAAVRAVAALCDAACEGVEPGSATLTFRPQRLHGGEFEIDVGTAGSIALVLQAMLPAAIASGERVVATVRGGTDVRAAPPMDYVRFVLLRLLGRMGVRAELDIVRRGFYPGGGGLVRIAVQPAARLLPFSAEDRGEVQAIESRAHVAHLPLAIAERMQAAARAELPPGIRVDAKIEKCDPGLAAGAGGSIVLCALAERTTLGAAQVAERGVTAEQIGRNVGLALRRDLEAGATLDAHAADQMLAFLALADAPSAFRAAQLSSHAVTAIWLLEQLTRARLHVRPVPQGVIVRIEPRAPFATEPRGSR